MSKRIPYNLVVVGSDSRSLAIARQAVEKGANVVIGGRHKPDSQKLAVRGLGEILSGHPDQVRYVEGLDINQEGTLYALGGEACAFFATKAVRPTHVFTGVEIERDDGMLNDVARQRETNLKGTQNTIKAFGDMVRTSGGVIAVTTSMFAVENIAVPWRQRHAEVGREIIALADCARTGGVRIYSVARGLRITDDFSVDAALLVGGILAGREVSSVRRDLATFVGASESVSVADLMDAFMGEHVAAYQPLYRAIEACRQDPNAQFSFNLLSRALAPRGDGDVQQAVRHNVKEGLRATGIRPDSKKAAKMVEAHLACNEIPKDGILKTYTDALVKLAREVIARFLPSKN